MKLHEYQAKQLIQQFGATTPEGEVAETPEQARAIAEKIGRKVVVKAQVLMGGRGKAGGIKLADTPSEAESAAREIIGKRLISVQNPTGLVAERVLIEEAIAYSAEYYIGITVDRTAQRNAIMISTKGGMDIEEVAATDPEAIATTTVDPAIGVTDFQVRKALTQAGFELSVQPKLVRLIKSLYRTYEAVDASLVEINPCVLTEDGRVIAADAKIGLDENALYRHPEWAGKQEESAEDPIEAEAQKRGIAYVRLTGNVGIIGNGAGLVMCSLDEVARAGGKPANFLDIGGGAKADQVRQAVELVLMDPNVKGLLFNIFGGITRGDEVAKGILEALSSMNVTVPIVVRLSGTRSEEGRALLQGSPLIPAETMQEAASKIVGLVA